MIDSIKIYGLERDHYADLPVAEGSLFEEWEFAIDQIFNGTAMGQGTCNTTSLATDLLYLEDYFLLIAQYRNRLLNNGETITNEELWQEFELDCVRDRFLCKYSIDILELGRDDELLSRAIECIYDDEGSVTRDRCTHHPSYTNIGNNKVIVILQGVYDNTNIQIEGDGVTTISTDYNTYPDRVVVTLHENDVVNLMITYNECRYSLRVNTKACDYAADGHYDPETDEYIVYLVPQQGADPISPKFYSEGMEVPANKYKYNATTNRLTIPHASQFAGNAGVFINYGCGMYNFEIPDIGCNTRVERYEQTEDDLIIHISERTSGLGNYPPPDSTIHVSFDNTPVQAELVGNTIVLRNFGKKSKLQGVFTLQIGTCDPYIFSVHQPFNPLLPKSYLQTVCGTLSVDEKGEIVQTLGCDENTYEIGFAHDPVTNVLKKTITWKSVVPLKCQQVGEWKEYECREEKVFERTCIKKCCPTNNEEEDCVEECGEWIEVEVEDKKNPCLDRNHVVVPSPYNQEVCGTLSVDENNQILNTRGCDKRIYRIEQKYDVDTQEETIELTEVSVITNGCRVQKSDIYYYCDGERYMQARSLQNCCPANNPSGEVCTSLPIEHYDVTPPDDQNPCKSHVIVVPPEPYLQTVCGTLEVRELEENGTPTGNYVIYYTPGCDENTYNVSYTYDAGDNKMIPAVTLKEGSTVVNGCKHVYESEEYRCDDGKYQKRVCVEECCPDVDETEDCNKSCGEWEDIDVPDQDNPCKMNIIIPSPFVTIICGTLTAVYNEATNEWSLVQVRGKDRYTYQVVYVLENGIVKPIVSILGSPVLDGCVRKDEYYEYDCNLNTPQRRLVTVSMWFDGDQPMSFTDKGPWEDIPSGNTNHPCTNKPTDVLIPYKKYVCEQIGGDAAVYQYLETTPMYYTWNISTQSWVVTSGQPTYTPVLNGDGSKKKCTIMDRREECIGYDKVITTTSLSFDIDSQTWVSNSSTQVIRNSSECGYEPECDFDIIEYEITGDMGQYYGISIVLDATAAATVEKILSAKVELLHECPTSEQWVNIVGYCDDDSAMKHVYNIGNEFFEMEKEGESLRVSIDAERNPDRIEMADNQCYMVCFSFKMYGRTRPCCFCFPMRMKTIPTFAG
jgi:hypothetical protein